MTETVQEIVTHIEDDLEYRVLIRDSIIKWLCTQGKPSPAVKAMVCCFLDLECDNIQHPLNASDLLECISIYNLILSENKLSESALSAIPLAKLSHLSMYWERVVHHWDEFESTFGEVSDDNLTIELSRTVSKRMQEIYASPLEV